MGKHLFNQKFPDMIHHIRKPTICICENKDADQLCSNLCFHNMDSTIPLIPKSEISSFWPSSEAAQAGVSELVGNPEDRFSHDVAHIILNVKFPHTCHDLLNDRFVCYLQYYPLRNPELFFQPLLKVYVYFVHAVYLYTQI